MGASGQTSDGLDDASLQSTQAMDVGLSPSHPSWQPRAGAGGEALEIPGYRLQRLIGRGGMADVYLAEQVSLSRPVAIKILRSEFFQDEGFRTRFRAVESTVGGALVHPSIVMVFDGGVVEDRAYLVMEYLDGGCLTDRMDTALPIVQAKAIAIRIAEALAFAHARSIIHRDVKPANILFRADGSAVLADFGIAKLVNTEAACQLTGTGVILGSVSYMSPEQVEGRPVDHRADLYSLGIVLFLMLSGRLPYDSTNPVQTAVSHATAPIPRLPADVAAYQGVIDRLLAKRPEDRIQSAQTLVGILEGLPDQPDTTMAHTRPLMALGAAGRLGRLRAMALSGRARVALRRYPLWAAGLGAVVLTWALLLRLSLDEAPLVPLGGALDATAQADVTPPAPPPSPVDEPPRTLEIIAPPPTLDVADPTLAPEALPPTADMVLAAGGTADALDASAADRRAASLFGGFDGEAPPPAVYLSVRVVPEQARVRIMNIVPPYEEGMALDPGAYDLEVSAPGYRTYRRWHEFSAGPQEIDVQLSPRPPEPQTPKPLREIERFLQRILPS